MIYDILPVNNYIGNNSVTKFEFDFYIQFASQLKVYLFDENSLKHELVKDIDYSIFEIGNKNGSYIIFPLQGSSYGILNDNQKLSLELYLPAEQLTQYGNSSLLNFSSLENSFDYLTRLIQIIKRKIDLCVKVEECSDSTPAELMNTLENSALSALSFMNDAKKSANSALLSCNTTKELYDDVLSIKSELSKYDSSLSEITNKANLIFDNVSPCQEFKSQSTSWGMPSDRYIDLTLGANGTDYTAPTNGYFYLAKAADSWQAVGLIRRSNTPTLTDLTSYQTAYAGSGNILPVWLPVKKGDVVGVSYNATGATKAFRFFYAEGEQ